jgi:hypothetical protein
MKRIVLTIAAAIGLVATGAVADRANAMPLGGVSDAADELNVVDQVQYVWGGRRYCWYDDGWNGPGWYWCGRYLVPGLGWGGGVGWRGWGRGGGFRGGGRGGFRGGGRGGFRGGGGGGFRGGGGGFRGGGGGGFRGGGGGGRGGGGGGRRSDIDLKHNVTFLGQLDNGLSFYRFSYVGSDKVYVGVMAQEVQNVMPDAVTRGSDGYLRVFYQKVGVKFQTYDQWLASGAQVPAGNPVRH